MQRHCHALLKNETMIYISSNKILRFCEKSSIPDANNPVYIYSKHSLFMQIPDLEKLMKEKNQTILTPLISLDTPGKATVVVIILADPDGHEICFVGDEAFRELSQLDPKGDALLNEVITIFPYVFFNILNSELAILISNFMTFRL